MGGIKMCSTMPSWFWNIYYLFIVMTLGAAVYYLIRERGKLLSALAVIFSLTVPWYSLINSIGRPENLNEFEFLLTQLQRGRIWSIYVTLGYLYLFSWWGIILLRKSRKFKLNR